MGGRFPRCSGLGHGDFALPAAPRNWIAGLCIGFDITVHRTYRWQRVRLTAPQATALASPPAP
eukprot:13073645-Alexandrium_andersonii.AAC.1